MSTSAVPSLIDYLVAQATASVTLGGNPTAPVTIFDGPQVSGEYPKNVLWIGADLAFVSQQNPIATGAQTTQEWVGPGNRLRNEHLTIHCVADSYSAEVVTKTARDQAYAIMSAFEDMTRIDANMGGTVLFTDPGVTNSVLATGQTNQGVRALVGFDFNCFARIGG